MAENKDGAQKTEPATAKRLNEARDRGQVSKSVDVTTSAVLLIGSFFAFIFGANLFNNLSVFMKDIFFNLANISLTYQNVIHYYPKLLLFLAKNLLPIIGTVFLIVLAAEISQVGLHVASKKFTEGLNFKTIFNPFSGLKKIFFSGRSFFELVKSFIKLILLGSVVYSVLYNKTELTIGLLERPIGDLGSLMVDISFELVMKVGAVYILIAFGDFFYQRYRFKEDMKMTKQEVKDEGKQSEGDPKVKQRMRSIMRSRLKKIMLSRVPKADVIITNPTHFAIAIVYAQGQMNAPKVVAKGVDFLALQIRHLAEESNVPIVEEPPLARALFYSVEVDQEIPEHLFKAVAQILAYVYHLKKKTFYHKKV